MNDKEAMQDEDIPVVVTQKMVEDGQKAKEFLETLLFGGNKEKP